MTFTVAFLILIVGIAIGYRLPGPLARLKEFYRRQTYKPVMLRRYVHGKNSPVSAKRDAQ
ncbi:hypothetical protein RY831_11640 [Noviherbaspirillum sp. CPCC 100848]|uniref:Cellulose biosynthesis protein BcsF n=1 Tax=Noviherbaspirillum album TaxID=3080276 RepID=A0ABU6J9E9_9BURK|nr:hypothetical protein [Noviherbaspirillum sp. CPCC 100848]MEC4719804.1 hypothetical protein [Noviherbaspirillum sp. CPCC 100848]